jgi:hypothetical protein
MGKLDKKVLKFITAHEEMDLDVGDISIALRCDEDEVQEALDSLKGQGRIESVVRDGKTFWQLSMQEPFDEPDEPKNFSEESQIDTETVSFDLSSIKPPVKQTPEPMPMPEKPVISASSVPVSLDDAEDIDDDDGDADLDEPGTRATSTAMGLVIAVVVSVALSAIVAIVIGQGSKKNFSDGLQALKRTSSEAEATFDKRIEDLSAQVKSLAEKAEKPQPPPASAIHAMKPTIKPGPKMVSKPTARLAARQAAKAARLAKRKKAKAASSFTEESTAPSSSDIAPAPEPSSTEPSPSPEASPSDQSAPPPSSGTEDNATPPPSAPSTEESGQ